MDDAGVVTGDEDTEGVMREPFDEFLPWLLFVMCKGTRLTNAAHDSLLCTTSGNRIILKFRFMLFLILILNNKKQTHHFSQYFHSFFSHTTHIDSTSFIIDQVEESLRGEPMKAFYDAQGKYDVTKEGRTDCLI